MNNHLKLGVSLKAGRYLSLPETLTERVLGRAGAVYLTASRLLQIKLGCGGCFRVSFPNLPLDRGRFGTKFNIVTAFLISFNVTITL